MKHHHLHRPGIGRVSSAKARARIHIKSPDFGLKSGLLAIVINGGFCGCYHRHHRVEICEQVAEFKGQLIGVCLIVAAFDKGIDRADELGFDLFGEVIFVSPKGEIGFLVAVKG